MFAVIKTGGKQYRVSADDTITIERIEGEEGARVEFGQVLMVGEGSDVTIGTPAVDGARVTAEVLEQGRGPKTINFKKRRRQKLAPQEGAQAAPDDRLGPRDPDGRRRSRPGTARAGAPRIAAASATPPGSPRARA